VSIEDTLIDEVVETTETTDTTDTTPEGWLLADEVAGEGDRPEWFKNKYNSVTDQAMAYGELEKKFGGFTGAPDGEFELTLPEGVEGEFDTEDPRIGWFQEAAKESNMSQDTFTKLLHGWVTHEVSAVDGAKEDEIKALGNNAKARLKDLGDWGKANLSADHFDSFRELANSAKGVEVLEELIAKSAEGKMPTGKETLTPQITQGSLDELIADPRYKTSQEYRKEVEQKFKDFYG